MPLQYSGRARGAPRPAATDAVVFDVSHLGTVHVDGPGAFDRAAVGAHQRPAAASSPGATQYTHLLDPDDAPRRRRHHRLVGRRRPRSSSCRTRRTPTASPTAIAEARRACRRAARAPRHHRVPGGARRAGTPRPRAARRPRRRRGDACRASHVRAVQRRLRRVRRRDRLHRRGRRRAARPRGGRARACGSGSSTAGIRPAGLGARDTLRLEAGYPLHGHELGPGITPLQAGLGWVVRFDKGDFRGRAPLLAEQARGVTPPAPGPARRRPSDPAGRLHRRPSTAPRSGR